MENQCRNLTDFYAFNRYLFSNLWEEWTSGEKEHIRPAKQIRIVQNPQMKKLFGKETIHPGKIGKYPFTFQMVYASMYLVNFAGLWDFYRKKQKFPL